MRPRLSRARGVTAVEAAVGFSILGSVLAVAIPAFVRDVHSSRYAEPVAGLGLLGEGAIAYASTSADHAFPPSVPVTPTHPPRGVLQADPPGTWLAPTWVALHFPSPRATGRGFSDGQPHAFAFGFDSATSKTRSAFLAHAHGDLDGDGVVSTFELRGKSAAGDPSGPSLEPGMYVADPLE